MSSSHHLSPSPLPAVVRGRWALPPASKKTVCSRRRSSFPSEHFLFTCTFEWRCCWSFCRLKRKGCPIEEATALDGLSDYGSSTFERIFSFSHTSSPPLFESVIFSLFSQFAGVWTAEATIIATKTTVYFSSIDWSSQHLPCLVLLSVCLLLLIKTVISGYELNECVCYGCMSENYHHHRHHLHHHWHCDNLFFRVTVSHLHP